ncbi:MAG: hypothetical protein P8N76_28480 [Pirellulaceae bacterium]|nr:hypothetical protein [Pirellulaceae bacterium]
MAYILLWFENLTFDLLLVATLIACIGRLKRVGLRRLLAILVVLAWFSARGAAIAGLAVLRFTALVNVDSALYLLVSSTVCFGIGAVWLLVVGLRTCKDDSAVAASWPRGRLAMFTCIALGLQLMTTWNVDLAVRQQFAGLQAEAGGMGLSIAPARIPDRDNAAIVYEQSYDALEEASWSETHRDKWQDWIDLESKDFNVDDPDLKSFLKKQGPTLILLRQAAEKAGCHFGRNYSQLSFDLMLPELTHLRQAARLLSLDARYRAAQGDMQTALEDVGAIYSLAEHVGSDPLLISTLLTKAIDQVATDTFQEVLALAGQQDIAQRITSDQLQAIDLDGSMSLARLYQRSLRGETAFGLNLFYQMSNGNLDWSQGFSGTTSQPSPANSFFRIFLLPDDLTSYRKIMSDFSSVAAKPFYEARDDLDNLDERFEQEPMGIITKMITPALAAATEQVAQGDARHQTARLGLAVARYRSKTGDLPKTLEELVPDYIPILPRDPFDGEFMKYRVTDDGAVIYSVGPDGKDDSGTIFDAKERQGDIVFQLESYQ